MAKALTVVDDQSHSKRSKWMIGAMAKALTVVDNHSHGKKL